MCSYTIDYLPKTEESSNSGSLLAEASFLWYFSSLPNTIEKRPMLAGNYYGYATASELVRLHS